MIRFFRKIRLESLSLGKTKKYLQYALGEIILVVIGILIAIQINEWNQNRIEKKQYAIILQNLEDEFNQTKTLLTTLTSHYTSGIQASSKLMHQFGSDQKIYSVPQIDTLLALSMQQPPFYPPQPVLAELMNSGKLKSLSNKELKQHLFDWEANVRWLHFDYDLFISFSNDQFQPYINKKWSWKNIDLAEGNEFHDARSTLLDTDIYGIFQELEFENLIDSNLFHSNRLYKRLVNIGILIDNILKQIEVSLQD
ncbi:DUF6090 family protein [Flavilitoribacter nigricans]|uniref:Uncharacterized protein n=1 Tax=Flavilitoribacter nigricans (strain ATCC 23147 / DSM 23189 / NBRC 102662 / NCIMB 1420 / SS-2) TaxID=1122177 RepID=A0A2D0NEN3_FLAN2|nr:DUF6090 family protein [Flavilitoribacter nigricans]PHN06974.1 hypothetical protein CRP01_08415 [Flavilitoribacter nigricans DSM 23189 = NBRC 102662]